MDFISGLDASYKDEVLTPQGQLQDNYIGKIQIQTLPYLNTEYLGFLMDENNLSDHNIWQLERLSITALTDKK